MTYTHERAQAASNAQRQDACSTLVLNFHPDPTSSRANAALADAARRFPGVSVREIATLYASRAVDPQAEARRLLAADRIVLLFPVQWYAPPATFKAWADAVLTRMYYVAYEVEGRRMEGKPLLVAATVGTGPEDYGRSGRSLYPLEVLLRPLEAIAHRCGLVWSKPFLLYRAGRLEPRELTEAGEAFVRRLREWDRETEGSRRAPAKCDAKRGEPAARQTPPGRPQLQPAAG
jgi:putative NADPH-quinone reductase